jgi:hypothetical protein
MSIRNLACLLLTRQPGDRIRTLSYEKTRAFWREWIAGEEK